MTAEIPNMIKKIPTTQAIILGLISTMIPARIARIPPISPLICGSSIVPSLLVDCDNYIQVTFAIQVPFLTIVNIVRIIRGSI